MKKLISVVLALLIALSLVACGQKQKPDEPENPAVTGSGTAPVESSIPTDAPQEAEVTKGGTLVIAVTADAASMHPLEIRSPSNLNYANPIFETLLAFDENGDPQPFLAKSITEDVENLTYTLELNEGIKFHDGTELTAEICNWQGEPNLDGVRFDVYANELVAQAAVQSGDVHIMSPTDSTIISDMQSKGYVVYKMRVPQSCYTVCYNCVSDDPLSDVRVRQAMSYAIDNEALNTALFGDGGAATNQYALVGSTYYNEDVGIQYDLEKAKSLMKEAGYETGFATKLTVVNSPRIVEVCQVVADMLSEIGITVELNLVDGGAYMKAIGTWEPGMLLHTMSMYNGVDSQLAGNFKQGLVSGLGVGSFLHPDDLNELLLSASSSSKDKAVEQFKQAQKMIVEDYCLVRCLTVSFQTFVASAKLHDCGYGENTPYNSTLHLAWIEQ